MHFYVFDTYVFAVPKRGSAKLGHLAVLDCKIMVVPKRITQIKKAILALDISALFERALAVGRAVDGHVFNFDVTRAVKCTFLVEGFIFHNTIFVCHFILKIQSACTWQAEW